jgi:hypothetical protein
VPLLSAAEGLRAVTLLAFGCYIAAIATTLLVPEPRGRALDDVSDDLKLTFLGDSSCAATTLGGAAGAGGRQPARKAVDARENSRNMSQLPTSCAEAASSVAPNCLANYYRSALGSTAVTAEAPAGALPGWCGVGGHRLSVGRLRRLAM